MLLLGLHSFLGLILGLLKLSLKLALGLHDLGLELHQLLVLDHDPLVVLELLLVLRPLHLQGVQLLLQVFHVVLVVVDLLLQLHVVDLLLHLVAQDDLGECGTATGGGLGTGDTRLWQYLGDVCVLGGLDKVGLHK